MDGVKKQYIVSEVLNELMGLSETQKFMVLSFIKGMRANDELRASEPLVCHQKGSDADAQEALL